MLRGLDVDRTRGLLLILAAEHIADLGLRSRQGTRQSAVRAYLWSAH